MKAKRITADELEYHIYELAELLRIPDDVINAYLIDISEMKKEEQYTLNIGKHFFQPEK